eukprot:TRINITY_DN13266_c0_g1_i1.p1 TRINITY_DN13266_c0_g1~~TRINITY_DN13266_c0_g1_i1.p1  ORF type:complete len:428 (-),score=102.52 TRINITY_DN13266_c0_g1_i1:229-1512(-)
MGGACSCERRGRVRYLPEPDPPPGARKDKSSSSSSKAEAEPDPEVEKQKAEAKEMKEKGNEHFKKQEYEEALTCYNKSVTLHKYEATTWLNRSMANRQLGNFEDAVLDAEVCLELVPSNAKAFYNKALALKAMGKVPEAIEAVEKGLKKNSDNKALQNLLTDLEKERFEAEKAALQTELMGHVSQAENKENECPVGKLDDASMADIKKRASAAHYVWQNGNPSKKERESYKEMLTGMFRSKYQELAARVEENNKAKSKAKLDTTQYEEKQKQELQITGGHRPMKRPDHVDLPEDYKKPIGIITPAELGKWNCDNPDKRFMLSCYGRVFDVSDRPDKYGPDGPYHYLTGKDLTWGLFAGVDTEDYTNRFYDLFKAKDMGKDKMNGVCSWNAWYEVEYGTPIGYLKPYQDEANLPAPPLEEIEEACCVM